MVSLAMLNGTDKSVPTNKKVVGRNLFVQFRKIGTSVTCLLRESPAPTSKKVVHECTTKIHPKLYRQASTILSII
jgi:hypothetical protein